MFYKNTAKDWEKKKKRKRGKPLGIYKCSENFYLKPIEKKKKKKVVIPKPSLMKK